MADKTEKSGPPMETITPAVGPNVTGLVDSARNAQWREEDAGGEPHPDPDVAKARKRTRKSGGE